MGDWRRRAPVGIVRTDEHLFAKPTPGGDPRGARAAARRSVALTPGQPACLSRQDAMALLGELKTARRELERLVAGLHRLLETPMPSSRSPVTGNRHVEPPVQRT
jgi:hypothetical protein